MLALLEDYVRWSIGHLPPERERSLQQLVPGLMEAFATDSPTWQGCIAAAMELPDTMPAMLDDLFRSSGAASALADGTLDLTDWVRSVVDKNFT